MDFSKINLADNQDLAREIISRAVKRRFKDRREFEKFRNSVIKEKKGQVFHNLYLVRAYRDLLKEGKIEESDHVLDLIQKRKVRTMSGVTPVTVMTKPFPCQGKCIYCPTDIRMPKSYLVSQPAAQRGFRQRFNPYTQVFVRLKALLMTGHEISKVELRVLGGTWSNYEKQYQTWFLKRCLQAMNEFHEQIGDSRTDDMANLVRKKKISSYLGNESVNTVEMKSVAGSKLSWEDVVKENENAKVRCIGINIETRPDCITRSEVRRLRRLGVTKVEMGVQTTDDEVQKITERGHGLQAVRDATALLKDAGFKIGYHMMPNLPGSSIDLDKKMVGDLFKDSSYQPDYLKIYPCMVLPKAQLVTWYREGRYKSYDDEILEEVLYENMKSVPEWCRIDRVARDIPSNEIESGSKFSNIRQKLEARMLEEGSPCRDIRSREVGGDSVDLANIKLVVREYRASGGKEIFLSYEDLTSDKLLALLRLRFPGNPFIPELDGAALIREVHVYGKQAGVGKKLDGRKQHVGWGTRLMNDAKVFAKKSGYNRLAVIAGIGTREYYKKFGYKLQGTYMCLNI